MTRTSMTIVVTLISSFLLLPTLAAEEITLITVKDRQSYYFLKDNKPTGGVIVDIAREIFKDSHYKLDYKNLPTSRMYKLGFKNMSTSRSSRKVAQREDWIHHGSPTWTKASELEVIEFSKQPLFTLNNFLVSLKKNNSNYAKLSDLYDKTLILIHSFRYFALEPHFKSAKNGKGGRIEETRAYSYPAAFKMLRAGRGDYVVVDQLRGSLALKKNGFSKNNYLFENFRSVMPAASLHLVFNKDMPQEKKNYINKKIKTLLESGKIDSIVSRYID